PAPEPVTGGVKLIMAADLELRAPAMLIREILELGITGLIYSDPGIGKTFVSIGIVMSVVTGEPFLGHEVVNPGPAVFVVGEGGGGFIRRLHTWVQDKGYDLKKMKLAITKGPVGLGDPMEAAAL